MSAHPDFENGGGGVAARVWDNVSSQLAGMFRVDVDVAGSGAARIRTPFVLPDGTVLDLYRHDTDEGPALSDLGETYGCFAISNGIETLTDRQSRAYDDVCQTYHVERRGVILLARIADDDVGDAVARLAQAVTALSFFLDCDITDSRRTAQRRSGL